MEALWVGLISNVEEQFIYLSKEEQRSGVALELVSFAYSLAIRGKSGKIAQIGYFLSVY